MYKIAFLSSSGGTNFQSFIDAQSRGELPNVEISCLLTDKPDCGAVAKAEAAGVSVCAIDPADKSREAFDHDVMKILDEHDVDLVVCGGYMRIIGSEMVGRYARHILNVHPSLLPKFSGGMNGDVHQAVLDASETETGMTIHFVDEGIDTGDIILQKSIPVDSEDTAETLRRKVQDLEKEWYPKVVAEFAKQDL
jgi:phosphoribosylglycinamide formyltransferase 1